MASINISEDDFTQIAFAANAAKDRGDMEEARALDKIARKINAALTSANPERKLTILMGCSLSPIRWQDMPSTIDEDTTHDR